MCVLARLDQLPLCRPHYVLLVMGGLGYTFDGMDAAIVAFLLPSVQEEWGLERGQLGIIGSATPFGFLFGAALAGILGDRIGRRAVMMYALLFYCAFTLVAAAAPSYESSWEPGSWRGWGPVPRAPSSRRSSPNSCRRRAAGGSSERWPASSRSASSGPR